MPHDLSIERLFGGLPLLSPRGDAWESGVTFNTAAVLLEPTPENLPTIRTLLGPDETPRAIVALHYRARPQRDPGFRHTRSYVGLSVHEPDLTPIRRFEGPVLGPGYEGDPDVLGAEDPRVTKLDDAWWMTYCGVSPFEDPDPDKAWLGSVCLARSTDLVEWTKCGVAEGFAGNDARPYSNKDGVLFHDRIDGKAIMLHRPMSGDIDTWGTAIAWADRPKARTPISASSTGRSGIRSSRRVGPVRVRFRFPLGMDVTSPSSTRATSIRAFGASTCWTPSFTTSTAGTRSVPRRS